MKFQQTLLRWSIGGMVAIVLSLFGSAGLLGWQNAQLVDSLRNEMMSEIKRLDARFDDMNQRFEDMDRRFKDRFDDMNRRFEDLKQAVLARRQ